MTLLATVLYEDKMLPSSGGSYPLHDLVMRLVEDEINGETWKLLKLVDKNPRKGIGNVINDVTNTAFFAGAGQLYLLVDRDVIAKQLGMQSTATNPEIVSELRRRSDAPDKLHPYFLVPNVEGLLQSIQACDRALMPGNIAAALKKKLNERDIVFNEIKKPTRRGVRDCVRNKQPGIDALAKAIAAIVPDAYRH
jgi:hypothetical protein